MIKLVKNNYNENQKIWYKLIQLKSIRTQEQINVGIVYISDKEHKRICFKLFEDKGYMEKVFPIFKEESLISCDNILNVKLRLKMINEEQIKITRNITISETKLYVSDSIDIKKEIFERYVTIETTKKFILPFYKRYKELLNTNLNINLNLSKIEKIEYNGLKDINSDVFKYLRQKQRERV